MILQKLFLLSLPATFLVACDSSALRVTSADTPVVIPEIEESAIVEIQVIDDEPICVDTSPVGDGWGWNGTESCRIAPDTISQLGFLKVQYNNTEADFASALFANLQNPLTPVQIESVYGPTIDTCQVTAVSTNNSDEPQLNILGQQLDLIDAGDTVVISSSAGTYTTLNSVQGSSGPFYQSEVALNVEQPAGLTADVIGAEFPAFTDVAIDEVPGLQITNPPEGQNIDAFNLFRWNANNVPLSVVEIYTSGIGANGQEILVGCTVVDDGSFSFPESVRSQMGNSFDDGWTTYLRIGYNVVRDGDALFITANSVIGTR